MDPHQEENRKLPAATMPLNAPPKRRKSNEGSAVVPSEEVADVAAALGFKMGDCIEVKWNIGDEDEEHASPSEAGASPKIVSVWWPATLKAKLNEFHTLTDEERNESANSSIPSSSLKVPIYQLYYSPLEELGFDEPSIEDVAFLSNSTLLTISSEEIMHFRKAGDPSPPPSPSASDDVEAVECGNDESAIARDFNSPDELRSYMNEIMQRCLKRTGIDQKMSRLATSQQLVMAERINKAQEVMLEKILNETAKMEKGNKVITADVVKRCMAQMDGL